MKTWTLLGALGLVLVAACGQTTSPATPDGGAHMEAEAPPLRDARADHEALHDGSTGRDGGAVRTMTSRSLLPTPVNDLLLDPFITADTSWGHFRVVVPAVTPAETGGDCPYIQRELVSASPTGVSGPAVLVNPTSLPASTGCTAILAPFVGSTETVNAQIWVSLSDSSGAPLPFPTATDAGASTVDGFLSVALIPNVLPATATPPNSYPLTLTTSAAVVLAGRSWGRLALASPVAIPDGGWFSITLSNGENGLYLAGPQVVPTASAQVAPRPGALAGRPITEAERGAVLQYGRLIRSRPRLRKHGR